MPFFGGMVCYCGWAWRFIASLLAAVKRLLSTTKAVLITMYDSNGLNIQKVWKRESQHFRILQPNGCKIRNSWDSQFSVEIILIPLLKGLKIGKSWNQGSQIFQISQPFWFEMAETSKKAKILKVNPTNSTLQSKTFMEYRCLSSKLLLCYFLQ